MRSKLIIILAFIFLLSAVKADFFNSNVAINNAVPSVTEITIDPSPIPSSSIVLRCDATAIDNNGYVDIKTANAIFWYFSSAENAADSIYNHYTNASCSLGSKISNLIIPIYCSFNLDSLAYNGNWFCKVSVSDNANSVGYATSSVLRYTCGDGICSGEDCAICPEDCGACVVTSPPSSGGGGGGGGGGSAGNKITKPSDETVPKQLSLTRQITLPASTNTFSQIQPNTLTKVNGQDSIQLEFFANKQLTDVKINIESLAYKPQEVTVPSNYVYNFIRIDHYNVAETDIKSAKISFKVEKSWLIQNDFSEGSVVLLRYEDTWQKLKTNKVSEDADYIYFQAESPGLSVFAITAKPKFSLLPRKPSTAYAVSSDSSGKKYFGYITIPLALLLIFIIVKLIKSRFQRSRSDRLKSYMKDAFVKGYNPIYVKKLLVTKGWKRSNVDRAIRGAVRDI